MKSNRDGQLSGLSTQERELIRHFHATEQTTVGVGDVLTIHPYSRAAANTILSRLARKGWLYRIKRGVYVVVPVASPTPNPPIEDAMSLAMVLFQPAFISGWSAAEHWDLTEQIFNTIAVITTAPQRKAAQKIGGIKFQVKTLAQKRFFGFKPVWFRSKQVQIADPSRMVIDILDTPAFGGGGRHTMDIIRNYWGSEFCNPSLLLEYAEKFGQGSIFKRLGFLAEEMKAPVSVDWMDFCRMHISKGITDLDPGSPSKGHIVTRWNLRINMPL